MSDPAKGTSCMVVLSGGQDSTTCLYWARAHFERVHTITFNYGQRHRRELEAARTVSELSGALSHVEIDVPGILESRSPLTDERAALEQYEDYPKMAEAIGDRVELTFVPLRNPLFLTVAANRAVARGVWDLVTGVCQEDNANYPDCRESYVRAQQHAINEALGTVLPAGGGRLQIHTPLMYRSKADTIRLAQLLPGCFEALAYSHTCYAGQYPPCGRCHACVLRAEGFRVAEMVDPLLWRANGEALAEAQE